MRIITISSIVVLFLGAIGLSTASAQTESSSSTWRGSISSSLWSGDRALSTQGPLIQPLLHVNGSFPISAIDSAWSASFDGNLSPQIPVEQRRSDSPRWFHLKDAFIKVEHEDSIWKIGVQSFSWGRADRLNPTDNLTARDYTSLFANDEEQNFGSVASDFTYFFTPNIKVDFIIQDHNESIYPSDHLERALPILKGDRNAEWAFRLDRSGEDFDWSISIFDGREKIRSLLLFPSVTPKNLLTREYAKLRSIGADLSSSFRSMNIRGELAYLHFDKHPHAVTNRLSHWYGVGGFELNTVYSSTFGVQYFVRRFEKDPRATSMTKEFSSLLAQINVANNQLHQWQDGFSLRFAQRLFNDKLDYELVALVNRRDRDWTFRPRLNFRYSDELKWSLGIDHFQGRTQSFFGNLRKNKLAFVKVAYIF